MTTIIAALFVENGGVYFDVPGIDPWCRERDARLYKGPYPVIAHPPCERWGRMWFGSPLRPDKDTYRLGDDNGCFAHALWCVRTFGGVIEHPEASRAYSFFGISAPPRSGGWVKADNWDGFTCCVEQGHYGHSGRKMTWLYACRTALPDLHWGSSGQRLDPVLLKTRGYAYARRCGITGALGGGKKKDGRSRTPAGFRDLLIRIAASAVSLKSAASVLA